MKYEKKWIYFYKQVVGRWNSWWWWADENDTEIISDTLSRRENVKGNAFSRAKENLFFQIEFVNKEVLRERGRWWKGFVLPFGGIEVCFEERQFVCKRTVLFGRGFVRVEYIFREFNLRIYTWIPSGTTFFFFHIAPRIS